MRAVPPIKNPCPLSDALYSKCMDMARKNPGHSATPWIHLADAVSRGTITPLEAYDAIMLGRLPEFLTVRASLYSHLL